MMTAFEHANTMNVENEEGAVKMAASLTRRTLPRAQWDPCMPVKADEGYVRYYAGHRRNAATHYDEVYHVYRDGPDKDVYLKIDRYNRKGDFRGRAIYRFIW